VTTGMRWIQTRRFKRAVRRLSYCMPRTRLLYRVCKLYVDNALGDNNADMQINGEIRFLRSALAAFHGRSRELVVLDVGANRGQWCREVLAMCPQAQIHCFEPAADTWQTLRQQGFPSNVVCNRLGLGAQAGTMKLYFAGQDSERNSLYRGVSPQPSKSADITMTTIDKYCRERAIPQLDFVKIDVEGHDFAVLQGARQMLREGRISVIQFEYGAKWIEARTFLEEVFHLLRDLPYELWKIMPRKLERISSYSAQLERFENANYVLKLRAGA